MRPLYEDLIFRYDDEEKMCSTLYHELNVMFHFEDGLSPRSSVAFDLDTEFPQLAVKSEAMNSA